jgi:hypothetical protein
MQLVSFEALEFLPVQMLILDSLYGSVMRIASSSSNVISFWLIADVRFFSGINIFAWLSMWLLLSFLVAVNELLLA